ncbi:hypothetical protein HZS_1983, partial [Henneguya salminicola]
MRTCWSPNISTNFLKIPHIFLNNRGDFNFISHNLSIIADMRILVKSDIQLSNENDKIYSSTKKESIYN